MSHDHDDYHVEPIPGLPERPPEGEHILWQGRPTWFGMANRAFYFRLVALYFTALLSWIGIDALLEGASAKQSLMDVAAMTPFPIVGLGLIAILATVYQRTTIYTITNKRVVLRFGIALTLSMGLPFKQIQSASLRKCSDGTGDIALVMAGDERLAFWHLWPLVRPRHLKMPQPMIRAVREPEAVAELLANAIAAESGGTVEAIAQKIEDETPTGEMVPAE